MDKPRTLREEILEGIPLTDTETLVLFFAAKGDTAGDTGKRLYLSPETIKGHRKNVIAKLAARNMTNAVAIGIGNGLINIERVLEKE